MTSTPRQRLYVTARPAAGNVISCTQTQSNYLLNVLRLQAGDEVLVFDGAHGEWRARLARQGRKGAELHVGEEVRAQQDGPDIEYIFAPLKRTRLDYLVQKATELGVARLRPVVTRRTIAERVNTERMHANVIEAAEQCGVLRVPAVEQPAKLDALLQTWDPRRTLVLCDEGAPVASPLAALAGLAAGAPSALLVGPEGGFAPEERALLLGKPFVVAISLGPRIMRADTAAVAALALLNACIGDWR